MRNSQITSIIVGAVFVVASFYKFLDLISFAFGLINSNAFPEAISIYLTYVVPIFELTLGLLLIVFNKKIALMNFAVFVLATYSIFLIVSQFTIINKSCSCISYLGLDLIPNLILNFLLMLMLIIFGSSIKRRLNYRF